MCGDGYRGRAQREHRRRQVANSTRDRRDVERRRALVGDVRGSVTSAVRPRPPMEERHGAAQSKSRARAARTTLADRDAQGLWTLTSDATRRTWKLAGPAVPRPHRPPRDRRSARRQDAAGRGAHRPSRPDDVSLDAIAAGPGRKRRTPPAFARGSGRIVDHTFWLTPGHASRARRLVRRHVAAGTVPLRRRRRDLGRRRRLQRASAAQGVVRRRPGRHAGRPEAAFDPDRSARSARTCTSACRAAACSSRPTAAPTGAR